MRTRLLSFLVMTLMAVAAIAQPQPTYLAEMNGSTWRQLGTFTKGSALPTGHTLYTCEVDLGSAQHSIFISFQPTATAPCWGPASGNVTVNTFPLTNSATSMLVRPTGPNTWTIKGGSGKLKIEFYYNSNNENSNYVNIRQAALPVWSGDLSDITLSVEGTSTVGHNYADLAPFTFDPATRIWSSQPVNWENPSGTGTLILDKRVTTNAQNSNVTNIGDTREGYVIISSSNIWADDNTSYVKFRLKRQNCA